MRRSSLSTEDLEVIEGALTEKINTTIALEGSAGGGAGMITIIAPLFATREKILAMKSRGNTSTAVPKPRKARGSRTDKTETTEA